MYAADEDARALAASCCSGGRRPTRAATTTAAPSSADGETLAASWDPWLKVGVQIDADRVYPVHAFDRVFVFWPIVEAVRPDPAAGTLVTTDAAGGHYAAPTRRGPA